MTKKKKLCEYQMLVLNLWKIFLAIIYDIMNFYI